MNRILSKQLLAAFVGQALIVSTLAACAGSNPSAPAPVTPVAAAPTEAAPAAAPADVDAPPPELAFPADEWRKQQPAAGDPHAFKAPAIQRFKLKSGIEVFLVERHTLPTVSMQLVFPGGEGASPAGKEGLASLCVGVAGDGSEKLDKLAFEEAQADLASEIGTFAAVEEQGVSMDTLASNLDATIDLWSQIILTPGLRQEDFDRAVKRRLNGLVAAKANAPQVAGRLSSSITWGEKHPYGRIFTETSTGKITLADCKAYVKAAFKPAGAQLFVVGDVTQKELTAKLDAKLAPFKGAAKASAKAGKATPRKGRVFFVDVPGAPQSVVRVSAVGPERKAKDYYATSIMSTILGGGFASRINMNIREKHGYAYGAGGGFGYTRAGSVYSAQASVRADVTKESVEEMVKEIRGMIASDATDQELTREKDGAILSLPAQWATGASVLGAYKNLVYYGLPLNYYDSYVANVQKLTKADLKKAATQHLKPDALQLLVVGDGKTVLPKLQDLVAAGAFGKGTAITVLDADGNIVPSAPAAATAPAAK